MQKFHFSFDASKISRGNPCLGIVFFIDLQLYYLCPNLKITFRKTSINLICMHVSSSQMMLTKLTVF